MNLEQQVCSLELSKRLKELGVKQESLFNWVLGDNPDFYLWVVSPFNRNNLKGFKEQCSAFTVAELGEMLPGWLNGHVLIIRKGSGWFIRYEALSEYLPKNNEPEIEEDSQVEAMGKMLVYLLENKLMEIPK